MVVWELIRFCKENGVSSGVGRGSAAGCLLSWCLDITKIDPVRFDLYFERFLNPERKCLTEKNSILMADGSRKNITDLNVGDLIKAEKSNQPIVEIQKRILEEHEYIFKITSQNGIEIEITGNHVLPVLRDGIRIEIMAKELMSSDFIFVD
jgi:intein/homing endonuclease